MPKETRIGTEGDRKKAAEGEEFDFVHQIEIGVHKQSGVEKRCDKNQRENRLRMEEIKLSRDQGGESQKHIKNAVSFITRHIFTL